MRFFRRITCAVALSLVLMNTPAKAEWHRASSDNFVIYSDSRPGALKEFAELLEHYHSALEMLTGRDLEKPSPSNRVTIYVVGSERTLRKLYGAKNSSVAGFYIPRASGSRAFVPRIKLKSGEPHFSTTVLLHEYAHHFMISSSRYAMPRWLSEGSAEFFASALMRNDALDIGRPAYHRGAELKYANVVTVEELLDPDKFRERHGNKLASFYGRSWALYHFLSFSDERKGQLSAYWRAVASGMDSRDAAEQIFGDLDAMERDLKAYLRKRRISGYRLQKASLPIGPIAIEQMSSGMDEMLPIIIQSQRGVTHEEAQDLLPEAREVAERFPNDADVLAALAEAEFDAGNSEEAVAIADRAIAIDPSTKHAYLQKGYALFALAQNADDEDAAFKDAMRPLIALNKLEPDHPMPLVHLYYSYVRRGKEPSETARHALERASQLAPFDLDLAFNVGMMQAREGKTIIAAQTLAPLAANPHGGGQAQAAEKIIAMLEEATEGEPFYPIVQIEGAEETEGDGDSEEAADGLDEAAE